MADPLKGSKCTFNCIKRNYLDRDNPLNQHSTKDYMNEIPD